MERRYLRVGFNFDSLRGLNLIELGEFFNNNFDKSFYLIDVRDDITSGNTFLLLESKNLKVVKESESIPVVFVKENSTSDGQTSYEIEDYCQYMDVNKDYTGIINFDTSFLNNIKSQILSFPKIQFDYKDTVRDSLLYGTGFMYIEEDEQIKEFPYTYNTKDDTLSEIKTCSHEFKEYNGFTSKYEYCIHCDMKKDSV